MVCAHCSDMNSSWVFSQAWMEEAEDRHTRGAGWGLLEGSLAPGRQQEPLQREDEDAGLSLAPGCTSFPCPGEWGCREPPSAGRRILQESGKARGRAYPGQRRGEKVGRQLRRREAPFVCVYHVCGMSSQSCGFSSGHVRM